MVLRNSPVVRGFCRWFGNRMVYFGLTFLLLQIVNLNTKAIHEILAGVEEGLVWHD